MLFVQEALYTQQCCKYWEEENGTKTRDLHLSARERNINQTDQYYKEDKT